jgi:hypothetical protein
MRLRVSALAVVIAAAACGSPTSIASSVSTGSADPAITTTAGTQPSLPADGLVRSATEIEGKWRLGYGLPDFDGKLLLHPQSDGRIVSLQANGGDSCTVVGRCDRNDNCPQGTLSSSRSCSGVGFCARYAVRAAFRLLPC